MLVSSLRALLEQGVGAGLHEFEPGRQIADDGWDQLLE